MVDRYDAMASIPRFVVRDVIAQQKRERLEAMVNKRPYCFICNQKFVSPNAVWQHCRDKHNGEGAAP